MNRDALVESSLEEALTRSRTQHPNTPGQGVATKRWGKHVITVQWALDHQQWWLRYPAQPQQTTSHAGNEYFAQFCDLKDFVLFTLQIATRTGWASA